MDRKRKLKNLFCLATLSFPCDVGRERGRGGGHTEVFFFFKDMKILNLSVRIRAVKRQVPYR